MVGMYYSRVVSNQEQVMMACTWYNESFCMACHNVASTECKRHAWVRPIWVWPNAYYTLLLDGSALFGQAMPSFCDFQLFNKVGKIALELKAKIKQTNKQTNDIL